jgi:hypothetical protein
MHVVASTRSALPLRERHACRAEHDVVNGMAIDPGSFIPWSSFGAGVVVDVTEVVPARAESGDLAVSAAALLDPAL